MLHFSADIRIYKAPRGYVLFSWQNAKNRRESSPPIAPGKLNPMRKSRQRVAVRCIFSPLIPSPLRDRNPYRARRT